MMRSIFGPVAWLATIAACVATIGAVAAAEGFAVSEIIAQLIELNQPQTTGQ